MTTIAWDGHTLAADSLHQCGNWKYFLPNKKIIRVLCGEEEVLVASAGEVEAGEKFIAWVRAGMPEGAKPDIAKDADFAALVVMGGTAMKVETGLVPFEVQSPHALGSGRDFALAAMYLGRGAAEAVAVACALDMGTGGEVQAESLIAPASSLAE